MCRRCSDATRALHPSGREARRVLRDPVQMIALLERVQRDQLHDRAEELRVSASEVVRRALTRELGSP